MGFMNESYQLEKEKDEALAASADLLDEEEWKTAYDSQKIQVGLNRSGSVEKDADGSDSEY